MRTIGALTAAAAAALTLALSATPPEPTEATSRFRGGTVVWGMTVFARPDQLRDWLRARGQSYGVWTRQHPRAVIPVDTREPASEPRATATSGDRDPPRILVALAALGAVALALVVSTRLVLVAALASMLYRAGRASVGALAARPVRRRPSRAPSADAPAAVRRPSIASRGRAVLGYSGLRRPGAGTTFAAGRSAGARARTHVSRAVAGAVRVCAAALRMVRWPVEALGVRTVRLVPHVRRDRAAVAVAASRAGRGARAERPRAKEFRPPVAVTRSLETELAAAIATLAGSDEEVEQPPGRATAPRRAPAPKPSAEPSPVPPAPPAHAAGEPVADAVQEELCEVAWWRGYLRSEFVAWRLHANGAPRSGGDAVGGPVASSPPFRWREAMPHRPPDAVAAYEALVAKLIADGWVYQGRNGAWYAARFRRAVPTE